MDEYQDTLRATVASAGNDHRLGAQEAPPAIISIFLGDELNSVVESIISGKPYKDGGKRTLQIGIDVLPTIPQDNTDRNRTSPMAFTGNKFEFRMLGSSQSISGPNIALNTIMAKELNEFASQLEDSKNFQADLQKLIKKVFTDHQRIIFNGNGYDESWVKEAEKRGLDNLISTSDALPHYASKKNVDLYVSNGIYTEEELQARSLIHVETYNATISIEARTMADMIRREILPAVSSYATDLARRVTALKGAGVSAKYESETLKKVSTLTDALADTCDKLSKDLEKVPEDATKAMNYYHKTILSDMAKAREEADALETLTDEEYWPFPVYSDLLFSEN